MSNLTTRIIKDQNGSAININKCIDGVLPYFGGENNIYASLLGNYPTSCKKGTLTYFKNELATGTTTEGSCSTQPKTWEVAFDNDWYYKYNYSTSCKDKQILPSQVVNVVENTISLDYIKKVQADIRSQLITSIEIAGETQTFKVTDLSSSTPKEILSDIRQNMRRLINQEEVTTDFHGKLNKSNLRIYLSPELELEIIDLLNDGCCNSEFVLNNDKVSSLFGVPVIIEEDFGAKSTGTTNLAKVNYVIAHVDCFNLGNFTRCSNLSTDYDKDKCEISDNFVFEEWAMLKLIMPELVLVSSAAALS